MGYIKPLPKVMKDTLFPSLKWWQVGLGLILGIFFLTAYVLGGYLFVTSILQLSHL